MKKLNRNTKKALKFIQKYNCASTSATIFDVYKKPSCEKISAWTLLLQICRKTGGRDFKIISHNCQTFSVAWITKDGYLHIDTGYDTYLL